MEQLGIDFRVISAPVEESPFFGTSVETTVIENARRKAFAAIPKIPGERDIVLSADTLVSLGEQPLSKPADRTEALQMLHSLSGKTHRVLTGMCVVSQAQGHRLSSTETKVTLRHLSDEEIESYAATKEPYDKAGSYGIQAGGSLFLDHFEGSYSNIVGLPIETLLRELSALTSIPAFSWLPR